MRKLLFVLAISLPALAPAQATMYQCEVNGSTAFSDQPCGDDAKEITVDPVTIGGQLDSGTNVEFYKAPQRSRARSDNGCPFINSTDLKRLTIQHKIARGMKPDDVRRSWGAPTSIRTGRRTQWAYHYTDYSARYVYFENGCVADWSGYYR